MGGVRSPSEGAYLSRASQQPSVVAGLAVRPKNGQACFSRIGWGSSEAQQAREQGRGQEEQYTSGAAVLTNWRRNTGSTK